MLEEVLDFFNILVENGAIKILAAALVIAFGAAGFLGWHALKDTATAVGDIDVTTTVNQITEDGSSVIENSKQKLIEKAEGLLDRFRE